MKVLIFYTYNKGLLSGFFQELSERLNNDNFEVFNFHLKHKKIQFVQNNVKYYGEKRKGFFRNYHNIYKIIRKVRPDVIVSNFSYINPAILFGRLLGVPQNIAWFHTAFGHTKPNYLKIKNKSFYLNKANVIISNSKQLEFEIHEKYGVATDKTIAIPFWTNISKYLPKNINPIIDSKDAVLKIGCPGRLVADKNQAIVIEALSYLKKSGNQSVKLYIAGTGPNKNQLHQLVKKLNLEQNVFFLGLLNVSEMAVFYDQLDIVILPSLHEAFGLVFIEAIAMGKPVIVSKAFGALDFIDKEKLDLEDFTFDPYSIQDLTNKLSPYIENKGKTSDYFKAIYDKNFKKDAIYNKVKSVIINKKRHF